ncbi:MAG: hypothetical protein VKJ85_06870 [Prochlorothrix sp.]|nr:hypothetical protein [Prochlorothrix sp.]
MTHPLSALLTRSSCVVPSYAALLLGLSVTIGIVPSGLAQPGSPSDPEAEELEPYCYTEHYTELKSAFYTLGEPLEPGGNAQATLFASGQVEFLRSAPAQLVGEAGTLIQYQVGQNTVRRFDFDDPERDGAVSLNFGPWFPVIGYEVDRRETQEIQTFYFDTNNSLKMAAEVLVRDPLTREVCVDPNETTMP